MVEYSLFDKIKAVYNLVVNSPLFLVLLFGILLMIIDILYISNKDFKTKIIYAVLSLIVIILFMYSYIDSILSIFDTIAKNIVAMIYFPTVFQYISMLVISIIILLISIISKKTNKWIKRINIFVLIANSFLFFLILDEIGKSSVDLTNKVSIYSNTVLMLLLELSIAIFVVWIIGLTLYKVIKKLTREKEVLESVNLDLEAKKENSNIEYVIVEKPNHDQMFTLEEYKKMRDILNSGQKTNKTEDKESLL